jgi:2-hydroxy-3-keto-5-methylthiopentenyl-1-phosphate phosphatase
MPSNDKEYMANYYAANRDKYKSYYNEKIVCECGKTVTKINMYKHKKTLKHKTKVLELCKSNNTGVSELDIFELLLKELKHIKDTNGKMTAEELTENIKRRLMNVNNVAK